jgi:hypothetical protein
MSERYTTIDCDGDWFGIFDTPEKAFAAIDDLSATWGPYTVAKLVPVPRPVPPRPTMDHGVHTLHVRDGGLRFATGSAYPAYDISTMRKAVALADATEQWEREHGGAQG